MQLHAYDTSGNPVHASVASKQTIYTCLECSGIVRVRGGFYRQKHFYHLSKNRSCHLSGKTIEHIHVQNYIKNILPETQCSLEYPFPSIRRIADVVWHERKIIFEVQCSSISPEEIHARNRDYSSEGYQVIWILHEKKYQKRKESEAERSLLHSPHYYTNIDEKGIGFIYDLIRGITDNQSRLVLGPFKVDLSQPLAVPQLNPNSPRFIHMRAKRWPICFNGDYLSRCPTEERSIDLVKKNGYFKLKKWFELLLIIPYRTLFRMLLEKFSL